jgi:hypothetical protein
MKKDFSFYEFVGIIVPSVILIFCCGFLYELTSGKAPVNLLSLGEAVVFIILAYGIGHIIQIFGGIFEVLVWKILRGWPTGWLTKEPRFGLKLLEEEDATMVRNKLYQHFKKVAGKNYGKDAYNYLVIKQLTSRADIFNANYSLFRGLAVVFLAVGIYASCLAEWKYSVILYFLFILTTIRMIRFGKYYAEEVFLTFLNIN